MLGSSVEVFVQRVKEKYPHVKRRLINDNGSQFISLDFKRLLEKLDLARNRRKIANRELTRNTAVMH